MIDNSCSRRARAGARRRDSSFAEEKRPTEKRLFALLDLDGTLFHMMPESELPGNIGHVTEAVVPLPDGAMRRLIQQQKKSPQGLLVTSLPSTTTAVVDDDSALLEEARHLMAVRRGTRQLLASLRQSGVELRVVTANLLGDAAVGALVDREDADVAASTAAAAAAAAESEPRNDDLAAGNDGDAIVPPPPARGWSGSPVVRVTVVVDRAPGSKRLPEDVAEALRNDPKGTKVVILDDNPTAWEARAKQHIWIVPQFDVRRPLTRAEFDDELGLLERISARCKRFFAAGSPPAPVVPKSLSSTTSPPPAPAPHSRRRRESRMPRSSAEKKVLEKTTEILGRQNGVRDVDDDEEWKEEDEDDPEWEQIVTASRE